MFSDEIRVINVFSKAATCKSCFEGKFPIFHSNVEGGQPRWIGKDYWTAEFKILFILTNPGSGNKTPSTSWEPSMKKLQSNKLEKKVEAWKELQDINKCGMPSWGIWEDIYFHLTGLYQLRNEVGFLNIMLCGAKDKDDNNVYPVGALRNCYLEDKQGYSSKILSILNPDICILSGSAITNFFLKEGALDKNRDVKGESRLLSIEEFKISLPDSLLNTEFFFMGHYAYPTGKDKKDAQLIKNELLRRGVI